MPYRSWCPICVKDNLHIIDAVDSKNNLRFSWTMRLCMAIPTPRKGPTRYQLTQLKKFVMENGFEQSIIQVDNEPASLQLAQEAERELTIPWRHSSSHTHQEQGAIERLHKRLFAQVRAIKFDLVAKCNLQTPDNVPEALLPWM
eukprot:4719042-Amphidinium_carterae.2